MECAFSVFLRWSSAAPAVAMGNRGEVLKAIKSTPHLMHIPIVVASGSEDPAHIRAVYALNGNCFMRKPSDLTQFLRFVEMCYGFWGSVTLSPAEKRRL